MNSAPNPDQFQFKDSSSILICADAFCGPDYCKTITASASNSNTQLVADPLQVMPRLLQTNFDLLLLDVDFIGGDVETFVRRIRDHFSQKALPVLILAGVDSIETRNAALAAGASDYLTKPLDRIEAALRIKNQLTLGNLHRAHQAMQHDWELEVRARTAKLDMLIESGLMMSMERSRSKLLNHILQEGQRLLNCDGGTMYLVTQEKTLRFVDRTKDDVLPFKEIPLYDPATGHANEHYVSTYTAIHKKTLIIDDVYQETRFDCTGTRAFDAQCGYRTVSLLTVPMAPRNGEVIGILQFINALDADTGAIIPFPADITALVEALAAQAAVALDNLQLVEAQKTTTEHIIRVLASAVDSKSPHTGHHCARVPELAQMLAEAACQAGGPLAEFNFQSEDEWFEFRVGAWLHDCGKVTTPEYVIDKATKLDVNYNRIHEVRMRFEVLLRDAEIKRLETLLNGGDVSKANAHFEQQKTELLNDFSFIAECNLGAEKMDLAHHERIRTIAQKTWLRHFDNRLGLSQEETSRIQSEYDPPLPAQEFLLSDKPWHIIPRSSHQVPAPRLGIKMAVPEHLYNHGEIHNLTIQKGTLTPEDRYKINEHMIETIKMLEQMPFPDSLKRVPEYATTHHEKLNGQGYPRGLTAAELSIPARIMAIADVFEAVTASDRPYKKSYKLSEALEILHGMKIGRHIDPDLFDLFLTSGVYMDYARKFLKSEQIEDVDITRFLGPLSNDTGPAR